MDDFEQVDIHPGRVVKFFNDLLLTKKPQADAPDRERFDWVLRHYSGSIYFSLVDVYHYFITWITQYYPFSLLYPDALMNAKNKLLHKFVLKIEKIAKKAKLPFLFCGNSYDGTTFIFEALLYKNENAVFVKRLESLLQRELGSAYIRRDSPKKIRIIIPNETMQMEYSKLRK